VERSRSSAYVVNDGSHVRLESCEAKDIRDNGYQANSSTMKLTGCTAELIANCGLLGIGSAKVSAANGALTGRIGAKTTGTALMTLDTCTISGCSDWGVAAMGGPINAVKCNFSGNKLGDIKPYEARQNH
jgi:hypothetical protein